MSQDTFSATTTGLIDANSYDFKSWLDARLPEDLFDIQNVYESDIIDTLADALNAVYQKIKFLPNLKDIDNAPDIYLVYLGQLLGIEDFDLLKAKLAATSGTTEDNYGVQEIDTFRRYIKEAIFRYKKKGTIEAVEKIFYYLNYLIETQELWTNDWVHYFPESDVIQNLFTNTGNLSIDDVFSTLTSDTSSMSISGSSDTLNEITSGGNIIRIAQSYSGRQYVIVNSNGTNKLYSSYEDDGWIDMNVDGILDIRSLTYSDPLYPTDASLKEALLGYILNGKFYLVKESSFTIIENSYTSDTVNKFIDIQDGSDGRFVYIETDNEILRADGNILSIRTWIDKTQYGDIPTVTADYVIKNDDSDRIYFFKRDGQPEHDFTILARGWTQDVSDTYSTSVASSAAETSGAPTSAYDDGITTLYSYSSFGKYTSGSGDYYQYTFQDVTSGVGIGSTSGWNPLTAIYYLDEDEIEHCDPASAYYNNPESMTSAYYFNNSLTASVSGAYTVPYNMPDFRIKHCKYHYDVFKNEATGNIEITYQKGNNLCRSFFHNLLDNDPHKKNSQVIEPNVSRYLSSKEDENYVYRIYINTNGSKRIIIESKNRSTDKAIDYRTFIVS